MKHLLYSLLLISCFVLTAPGNTASSQDLKNFLNNTDVKTTWLGIDFSEVRLLGDPGVSGEEIRDRYFKAINDLVLNEGEKYNVAKSFRKNGISFDLGQTGVTNSKADATKILTYNSDDLAHVNKAMVEKMVNAYDLSGKKGYGIVFIAAGLNKAELYGSMYVTILDMESKKILLTKLLTGKPQGFGFRNYWARSVYEILRQIDKEHYQTWQIAAK